MCYEEFMGILTAAGLVTDEFPERDAMAAFAQSMMTQVDEFDNDRHMKMQKVEFYEAIARAAEGLSLAPANSNPEEWPLDKRQTQTLIEKMDNMIPALLSVVKKEYREKFKKPEKDKSTGLYVVPVESPTKTTSSFLARF